MAKRPQKSDKKDRKRQRLIKQVIQALRELEHEQSESRARDSVAVDKAHIRVSAELAGFPRSFGSALFRRGITPPEAAVLFRDASRLPVQ